MFLPSKNLGKKNNETPGGHLVNPVYVQIVQPLLKWLFQKREEEKDPDAHINANVAIILFSVIYFEGLLEDILCSFVRDTFDYDRNEKSKSLADIERITSLDSYLTAFKGMGLPLDNFFKDPIDREDLKKLFYFRNLLAHGQRDSYTLIMETGDVEQGLKGIKGSYYIEINKFLIKRGLIKQNSHAQGNSFSEIFSDAVANWVFARIKKLALDIVRYIKFLNQVSRPVQDMHLKLIDDCLNKL